jgi:hypothetical protein
MRAMLVFCGLMSSCAFQSVSQRYVRDMLKHTSVVYQQESDVVLVEQALPSHIKTIEALSVAFADDKDILLALSQAYAGYAWGYMEKHADAVRTTSADAWAMYVARAMDYYQRAHQAASQSLMLHVEGLYKTLQARAVPSQVCGPKDITYVYHYLSPMLALAGIAPGHPAYMVDVAWVRGWLECLLKAQPEWNNGTLYVVLGAFVGSLPAELGGDVAFSEKLFEQAFALNKRKSIWALWVYAQTLMAQQGQEQKADKTMEEALLVPLEESVGGMLLNALARDRVQTWIQTGKN